jgi:hypothetical protein
VAESRFRAGAEGWEHPDWTGSFYPGELPVEWRLSYYAHFFGCVLVPAAAWRLAGVAGAESWAADTPVGFRFLLQGGEGASGVAAALRERCAGIVGAGGVEGAPGTVVIWIDAFPDLRALAGEVRRHGAGATEVLLIERGGDFGRLGRAATLLAIMGLAPDPGLV